MYVNLQIQYTLRDLKAEHIRASLEKKNSNYALKSVNDLNQL